MMRDSAQFVCVCFMLRPLRSLDSVHLSLGDCMCVCEDCVDVFNFLWGSEVPTRVVNKQTFDQLGTF